MFILDSVLMMWLLMLIRMTSVSKHIKKQWMVQLPNSMRSMEKYFLVEI